MGDASALLDGSSTLDDTYTGSDTFSDGAGDHTLLSSSGGGVGGAGAGGGSDPSSSGAPWWHRLEWFRHKYMRNVLLMTLCFSLVEAALLVVLSLETAINATLGEYANGALYICYTSAAIVSPAVIFRLGAKWGLFLGLFGYCLYIAGNIYPTWATLMPTAIVAGLCGSFLWTAEGTYLTSSARLHVKSLARSSPDSSSYEPEPTHNISSSAASLPSSSSLPPSSTVANSYRDEERGGESRGRSIGADAAEEADSVLLQTILGKFNGLFVGIFFLFIVVSQSLSSLFLSNGHFGSSEHPPQSRISWVFAIFTIVAVVSLFVLAVALPVLPLSERERSRKIHGTDLKTQLLSTVIILSDPRMLLMIPSNMAFGFVQGFQNSTFSRFIVKPHLGVSNIGTIASCSSLTGALVAYPFGLLSDKYGRTPVMLMGFLAHTAVPLVIMSSRFLDGDKLSDANEGDGSGSGTPPGGTTNWISIALLSCMFGLGNSVWNSMNAAIFGEFFPGRLQGAFANLKAWSGAATSIAFFTFGDTPIRTQLWLLISFELVGFSLYLIAAALHKRKTRSSLSRYEDIHMDSDDLEIE